MAKDQRTKIKDPGNMPYCPPQLEREWADAGEASTYRRRTDRNIIRRGARFAVRLWNGERQVTLGTFDTLAEARSVRDAEEARLGLNRRQD